MSMDLDNQSISTIPDPVSDPNSPISHANLLTVPLHTYIILTICYVFISVVGVIGNITVIVIIGRYQDMRSTTNVGMLSLAIADLLILVVCMPTALMEFYGRDQWLLGSFMCKFIPMLENTAANASASTILFISIERCVAICRPLKVRVLFNQKGVFISVLCVWLISMLFSIPMVFLTHIDKEQGMTVCRTYISTRSEQAYITTSIVLFYVVPFVTSLTLYVMIGRRLRFSFIRTHSQDGTMRSDLRNSAFWRQRKQIAVMMFIVAILFFLCLLPFKVISIWTTFDMPSILRILGFANFLNFIYVARIMYYVNSTVNPIIYSLLSSRFKKYIKSTFCVGKTVSRLHIRTSSKMSSRNTHLQHLDT